MSVEYRSFAGADAEERAAIPFMSSQTAQHIPLTGTNEEFEGSHSSSQRSRRNTEKGIIPVSSLQRVPSSSKSITSLLARSSSADVDSGTTDSISLRTRCTTARKLLENAFGRSKCSI